MSELERRFHETWLGMVQPTEGLVVSVPVLVDGQVMDRTHSAELQRRLHAHSPVDGEGHPRIEELRAWLASLLEWSPKRWDEGPAVPRELALYVPEGPQTIVPTLAVHAVGEPPPAAAGHDEPAVAAGRRYQLLVWDLAAPPEHGGAGEAGVGLSLDQPEALTGKWSYPPAAKLDRLLRHCRVPLGLLTNRHELRLVYAPHGESSGSLTFRLRDMAETGGRPILDAMVGLLHHRRLFVLGEERRLPALLAESRRRQANVTNELADQVFEALEALVRGVQAAAERDGERGQARLQEALRREADHLYGGLLTVLLRLVFLLYAEDRGLLPVDHDVYQQHMSVLGLFEQLQEDAGAHPDSMHRRFGAWDRLVATWRAVYLGVEHGELRMPPRHGQLFDPHLYPFIEGWGPGGSAPIVQPEARAAVDVPSVDDGTVRTVLEKLMVFQGQRLSYRALDVEQIGSVYEALMGYHAVELPAAAVCLRPQRARRVWVTGKEVLAVPRGRRAAWLKDEVGLAKASAEKLAKELDALAKDAGEQDVLAVLEGAAMKGSERAPAGSVVIQPGAERKRTSSHYTPRSLTGPIVQRTLEPLVAAMGEAPAAELLLSLKICDPAMGSGAFLVEVCRQLGEHVVAAWGREGVLAEVSARYGDAVMHARRMVAQRCVYGVDKNAFAVNLAKLSLWLVTLAKDLPFTFVDHALRHGDSLVGVGFEQIRGFHWKVGGQVELFGEEIKAALDEAVGLRQEIGELARDESGGAVREKERLLRDAEDALSRVRLIGDVLVGAFFGGAKEKERETERVRRMELVGEWLRGGREPTEELVRMQAEVRERTPVFHWMVEFPEVFYAERGDPLEGGKVNRAAFMDAFVGNPPFLGGTRISVQNGTGYRDWLTCSFASSGLTDLCAYFFRVSHRLLGANGAAGLIATNSIAQGDTRRASLSWIRKAGGKIYNATSRAPWPGDAAVTVSVVHFSVGSIPAQQRLDGNPVNDITAFLSSTGGDDDPVPLLANANRAVFGNFVLGIGFVFEQDNPAATPTTLMDELVAADPSNQARIFPYFGGEDLNTLSSLVPRRFIINFDDMTLKEAEAWPELLAILRKKVKPARSSVKQRDRRELWWLHATRCPQQRQHLATHRRHLALSSVSAHLAFVFAEGQCVFSHTAVLVFFDTYSHFGALQSRVHERWARRLSSSLEDRLRYTPSDCFETFPFPRDLTPLEAIGNQLYTARAAYMVATDQGLTKTYNALKDSANTEAEIVALRELHLALDRAVLAAYGWSDIEVPPFTDPVTPAEQAARQAFEDEVIDRLFVLNAERAKEEERAGVSARGKKKGKKAGKKKSSKKKDDGGQQSLV